MMHAVPNVPIPVALTRCVGYNEAVVRAAVQGALEACGWRPSPGTAVLVKPNLLRAHALSCTHPQVTAAACAWLLECGARVVVADSPGFGTAAGVARAIGLAEALHPLGLRVRAFADPVPVALPDGRRWGVARLALESDAILSIPKVKAHSQMRLTLAVKNLFGCVCGVRKAIAHTVQGHEPGLFATCVAALWAALPPVAALADGITAMHVTGPSGGAPYPLGCVAASPGAVALDTALGAVLQGGRGLVPGLVPVHDALVARHAPGARMDELVFPLLRPEDVAVDDFVLPAVLMDVSFRPQRLFASLCRRVWHGLRS